MLVQPTNERSTTDGDLVEGYPLGVRLPVGMALISPACIRAAAAES